MIKENQTGLRIENEELKAEVIKLTDRINELSDGYQNFYESNNMPLTFQFNQGYYILSPTPKRSDFVLLVSHSHSVIAGEDGS